MLKLNTTEFNLLKADNLSNYYSFWNFTNTKLNKLLTDLTKDDNVRIILIGDHGYRGDAAINPQRTFAAFYGFEEDCLRRILSVQDLGHLIRTSFPKGELAKPSKTIKFN